MVGASVCNTAMETSPYDRAASMDVLDDAETQDFFSQDSGSTVSDTSPCTHGESGGSPHGTFSDAEERLRRHAQHSSSSIPELKRDQRWEELASGRAMPASTDSVKSLCTLWLAEHPDDIVLPVRWHLSLPSTPAAGRAWSSPWIPFTLPRSAVFHALETATTDTHGASTAMTNSSDFSTSAGGVRGGQQSASAQLLLGRPLLMACLGSGERAGATESATTDDHSALREAAACVSRAHCTVYVNFTLSTTRSSAGGVFTGHGDAHASAAPLPSCHSVDVFALSPATSVRDVPLHPNYRYHFFAERSSCVVDGVLSIRLGPTCVVELALAPHESIDDGLAGKEGGGTTPAVHRPAHHRPSAWDGGLSRGSTTSLLAGDSTAVLATLSALSDQVALSDDEGTAAEGGAVLPTDFTTTAERDEAETVPPAVAGRGVDTSALEAVDDDGALPRLQKRRPPAAHSAAGPPKKPATKVTTTQRSRAATATQAVSAAPAVADETAVVEPEAVEAPSETVVFTTGLRLSAKDEGDLKAIGAMVNPDLRYAPYAKVMVAHPPLIRSVKLLTVLPYVENVVQQSWLDTVLHTRSLEIPTSGFIYSERKLATSIESENNFCLHDTMDKDPEVRQRLLSGLRFWVHKDAAPQVPPLNDLKSVLRASGGVVVGQLAAANVLVFPQNRPSLKLWRAFLKEVGGDAALAKLRSEGVLMVVPDDVFKCVLQQRPLLHSTVTASRQAAAGSKRATQSKARSARSSTRASNGDGATGPSSQANRKKPRSASSQQSRPSSTRRRTTS